jgi:hypothetical protein
MANDAPSAHPLRRYIAPAIITAFIVIAIIIGLAPRGPKGNFIQSSEFQMAMDSTPSGETEPLPGRMSTTLVLTFLDNRQRWCRVFSLSGAIEGGGVVCRQDGEWLLEGRTGPGESNGVYPVIDRLGGTVPPDAGAEQAAIAANWRSVAGN